jgi:NADH-quinone oxidoreductase subunit M
MIALLLFLIPLVGGLLSFAMPSGNSAKAFSFFTATIIFLLAAPSFFYINTGHELLSINVNWISTFNARFHLQLDGLSILLTMLCAFVFPIVFLSIGNRTFAPSYYGLMLLAQAGMMGVFMARDGLLFYFFWELALIPVYFLCSKWGNTHRIKASFKFFIYTFAGSLLMLGALIYLNYKEPNHSFAIHNLAAVTLKPVMQAILFWLFFIAFAIKMPIFPFHTWQPDAYEESNTGTTMILSSVMVKMGVFATVCWLLFLFPTIGQIHKDIIIYLSVFGMLYASLIAIRQNDLKRLIAYSSIAHIGLMSAALFTKTTLGWHGVAIQMFAHGVNILGMWMVVEFIEQRTGTRKISELGGLAHSYPTLTIMLVVIALANVALPLTNAFVGEFMMFNGLFQYSPIVAAIAGISIILSAVYTLRMIQNVFYGEDKNYNASFGMKAHELLGFGMVITAILMMGVYAKPISNVALGILDYLK